LCGAGLSMQPTYMANEAVKRGELEQVLPDWKANDMNIYALYSSRKFLPPTVRALVDFLSEYFKQHPWD
jgi:DNA-binding transcriptional LysR family regulator